MTKKYGGGEDGAEKLRQLLQNIPLSIADQADDPSPTCTTAATATAQTNDGIDMIGGGPGARCRACGREDFLPVRCPHAGCSIMLCGGDEGCFSRHVASCEFNNEAHNSDRLEQCVVCSAVVPAKKLEEHIASGCRLHQRKKLKKSPTCSKKKCKASLMVCSFECTDCGKKFCAEHRFPNQHKCSKTKSARVVGGDTLAQNSVLIDCCA